MKDEAIKARLVETADRCVKCGLCLPHCPTYAVKADEGESPRGRIALIEGLAAGKLVQSPRLWAHLQSCLECRACEAACPSLVAFGSLMDDARALQTQGLGRWRRSLKKSWLRILSTSKGARTTAALARLYRSCGLGPLVESRGRPAASRRWAYHRVAMQLNRPQTVGTEATADQVSPPQVALFLGCVAQSAQPGLSRAARHVLAQLGFRAEIPSGQCCCGAMYRHNGFPVEADRLLAQNASIFGGLPAVVTASACAAELRMHPNLSRSLEICRFLADLEWPRATRLRPLRSRVAVHQPCSHRNVLRDGDAAFALLRRIPQVELIALAGNAACCGAAGTYMLEYPMMSDILLHPKIDDVRQLRADFLVTTNTGCALHLAAGARAAGLDLEVLHPVELIERQLSS